jgi:methyl-accepting chemotaxis protein PixJ
MAQTFLPDPNSNKERSNFQQSKEDISSQETLSATERSPNLLTSQSDRAKIKTQKVPSRGFKKPVKAKLLAIASAMVMLPVLAVGTATYYFGSGAIAKQTTLARRADTTGIAESELARQKQLLAALLLGTGTTALLAGCLAAWGTKRALGLAKNLEVNVTTLELERQKAKEEQSQFFKNVIEYLGQSFRKEDIFETTVEEARKVLGCDRIVIYSLDEESQGVIVAESVAANFPKALGKTIKDPCFEARYLEKYRDGRVRALDNIYEAGMTPCYIEQLETLQVKANLVAPIVSEGKLFGLLVAHRCGEAYQWQPEEIEFLTQLAKQVGFALNNASLLVNAERLQQQARRESQWAQYLTDAIQQIYQSLRSQDILEVGVEETRRVLKCDRVVVYALNEQSHGVIVAESVAPGYTRALGKTIEDPCFEAHYLEKYRDGRVRSLNNIYEAGMTPCYIEQLETLQVKANLVAPIVSEGKLSGLLVAHQCGETRTWEQDEIKWVTQIATQVGFALNNANLLVNAERLQQQAHRESQWAQYLTDVIQQIHQSQRFQDILEVSVKETRRVLECDRVVVYSLNEQSHGVIVAESVAPRYTRALGKTIDDPCFEAHYLEKYRDGRVRALNNIYEAGMTPCYIEQLETLQVKANLVAPIVSKGKLFGLLVAHQCDDARVWKGDEIQGVTQIATQVGFTLENARLLKQVEIESGQNHALKNFTQLLQPHLDREYILKAVVEEVRKTMKVDRALIYSFDENWFGTIIAESVVTGLPKALRARIKDPCFALDYAEKYRNGRVRAIDNIYEAELTDCHLEQLEAFAVRASMVAPILQDDRLFGLLIVHQCAQPRQWQQFETDFLSQLAMQAGLALDRARLREESDRAQQEAKRASQESQRQQAILQRQISEAVADGKMAFETFSQEIACQSEAIADFLARIQAIDATQTKRDSAQQIPYWEPSPRSQPSQETNGERLWDDMTTIQDAIAEATEKIKYLNHSYQKIFEMMNRINELKERTSKPSALPAVYRASNLSIEAKRIQEVSEDSSLPIAEIRPSFSQTQNLALANQFLLEIVTMTNSVSEEFMTVTQSFNKLVAFLQERSNDRDRA